MLEVRWLRPMGAPKRKVETPDTAKGAAYRATHPNSSPRAVVRRAGKIGPARRHYMVVGVGNSLGDFRPAREGVHDEGDTARKLQIRLAADWQFGASPLEPQRDIRAGPHRPHDESV